MIQLFFEILRTQKHYARCFRGQFSGKAYNGMDFLLSETLQVLR